ncbi:MAG: 4-(cytidine 5'-diphospho)-2-C-methyl-D-erythritol kinase [Lachnospiraceae bacterium]|nr:4-(cytidine 5'-diphospho)-2-C-methyl-D-erythritol kinase [Lachnospiraceae bacterium]
MREQRLKARAKINLGLDVLGRRPDGYHDLRMVMQTVNLCDEITLRADDNLEKAPGKSRSGAVRAEAAGPEAAGSDMGRAKAAGIEPDIRITVGGDTAGGLVPADSGNLAYRAAQLLMEEYGISQKLEIFLEKRIPVAAGLAGGSSDAAAVMVGVNELFELKLTTQELMERGVRIGADVPYCILRGTALAEGIGERLTRLPDAPGAWVVLAKPPVQVSTKFVYSNLKLDERAAAGPADSRRQRDGTFGHPDIDAQVQAIRDGDLYRMAALMGNVLETVTIPAFPVIREIQEQMCAFGAVNAMMSGSGPTVFGLFDDRETAERACAGLKSGSLAAEVFLTTFFCPA